MHKSGPPDEQRSAKMRTSFSPNVERLLALYGGNAQNDSLLLSQAARKDELNEEGGHKAGESKFRARVSTNATPVDT